MNLPDAPPRYDFFEISVLTEQQLIELMNKDEDRVPRNVIDECARRGDAMLDTLRSLITDDSDWHEDSEVLGKWWLRLHAVMTLGLMESEAAGELLIAFMRRIDQEDDDSLQDWLAGYWHALFLNKPSSVIERLKEFAEDDQFNPWMRHEASDAYVYWFRKQGGQPLEDALDWLTSLVTDENNDMEFRLLNGNLLLEYPRDRFRSMLEELAAGQTGWSRIYDSSDVARAFASDTDKPKRDHFNNPWSFYLPEQIAKRQQRWREEDTARQQRQAKSEEAIDGFGPGVTPDFDDEFNEPYIRDTPKVGRNDPCPCGSGKKYKKCCLGVEG